MSTPETNSIAFDKAREATSKAVVRPPARLWRMMLLAVFGLLFVAGSSSVFAIAPSAPTNLRVDDVPGAVGTEAAPYFGWLDNDTNASEIQTGYEILVATNAADLNANFGDVWDSGQVLSSSENHVVYAGAPLTADTQYYWQVRTWDREGNAGPYSTNTTFVVGLLANSDWSGASWIKRNTTISDDYTYYRKSTNLPAGTVARATVYVTSVHKYALYVNGTLVGKGPAYAYAQYQYYNAYDITGLVTPGAANLFAIFNHWFGGGQGRPTSARGVLMEAVVHYADGTSVVMGTDGTWLQSQAMSWIVSSPSPAGRGGEGDGYVERIDSHNLTPTWFMPGFDDSAWTNATVIGSHPVSPWTGTLRPDLSRIVETVITPVSVTNISGKYVVDLGKVYAGMPSIQFSGGISGTVVNMVGGYALLGSGLIDTSKSQSTTMTYYATLNGSNFTYQACEYLGMRYFEIDSPPMPVTSANFAFVERNNQMNDAASSFTSPNATLNAVWDMMKHSISLCAQEQFLDTPTREKGAFLGDGALQSIAAIPVENERVLTRRALGDFVLSMTQWWSTPPANVGRMNAVYPNVDNARDIPDYTQSYLVWLWEYYQQSGDRAFLATNYTALTNIAQYVNRDLNPVTGLITNLLGGGGSYLNGIIDWPSNMRFGYDMNTVTGIGGASTVMNGWAWEDYDVVSRVANELGYTADSNTYRAMADALQAAMNARLLNASGVYIDGLESNGSQSTHASQHANAFPLALGIVPAAQQASVASLVVSSNMSVSALGILQLVRALGEANQGPALLNIYTNANQYGWARILALGGTATWESWTANTDGNSQSHGWGVVGLDGYVRYILGVKPLTPQFDQVQIKPLDFGNGLATASGTVPTDRGAISVEWDRNPAQYHLAVTIPVNVTATVYVPQAGGTNTTVNVDGVSVTGTATNGYVGVSGIGSGAHDFAYVIVTSPPVVGFSGGPTSGIAPLSVTFTNLSSNATNYVWNFGDGNTISTSSSINVTDTYTNAGNYTVILTATGYGGTNSLTNPAYIAVTPPPPVVAGFSATPTSGAALLTVTFTNLSSNATNYVWNFGDGNLLSTSSKANVTNTYANVGNYTVILTATGLGGTNSLTNTAYIVVTPPPPPVAGFNGTPRSGAAPLTVTFTNLSSNGTNYLWNFGDGNTFNTTSKTNVTDTYANAGSYTVILTATGLSGANSLNNTAYIVVTPPPPPVAGFGGTPRSGAAPLTVTFTNLSSDATNYVWNFGDGNTFNTTSKTNVTDTYANAGNYTVILTATGLSGTNSLTNTAYIVVTPSLVQVNITNADKGGNLTAGASWIGGVAPGATNAAVFDSTITSANPAYATNVLGTNTTWGEIQILNPALPIQISTGNTLTLNGLNSLGIDMSQAANALTLNCPVAFGASQTWLVANGQKLNVNGVVSGGFPLTINDGSAANGGSVIFGTQANTYSGGTVINGGYVTFGNAASAGTGTLTLGGGMLYLNGLTIANTVNVTGATVVVTNGNTAAIFSGNFSGSGTLNLVEPTNSTITFSSSGGLGSFTGTIKIMDVVSNAFIRMSGCTGSTAATFNLGNGSAILHTRTGNAVNLGALMGGPNTQVMGGRSTGAANTPYTIGANGLNTTFYGMITNGTQTGATVSLTKVGPGTLTLAGPNAYTGPTTNNAGTLQIGDGNADGSLGFGAVTISNGATLAFDRSDNYTITNNISNAGTLTIIGSGTNTYTGNDTGSGSTIVSNGTLLINGSISNGPVSVAGGTLGGSGSIGGTVAVQSGGTFQPGAGVGTAGTVLTINSNLTLASDSACIMAVSHNGHTNDQIASSGVSYGGTLTVTTNAGDGLLVVGDTFQLFNSGTYSGGSFSATNLPALSPGLGWSNSLAINGSIKVISVLPPAPVAGFSGTPTNLFATQTVTLTDASAGSITNWVWNYGDGNAVTNNSNASVQHAYAAAGSYTVSLTVNGAGGSSTSTRTNYVVVKPKAAIGGVVLTIGGNLVFSGTNGPAGAQYRILTTTNVALPLAEWTPVWTNVFGADGSYNYTNTLGADPAAFFLLVSP